MSRRINNNTATRRGPPIVECDMENGCESTACYIARDFYNKNYHQILKISSRNKLRDFFIKSSRFWMPPHLTSRGEFRHFDQVLFALVNDGQVCRVKKIDDGSHIVLWSDNKFRKPRRRINPPTRDLSEIMPIRDDISNTAIADYEEPGPGLTMEDLETGELHASPNSVTITQ